MLNVVVGVDPGFDGGICILANTTFYHLQALPIIKLKNKRVFDLVKLVDLLRVNYRVRPTLVIEQVGALPGNGSVGMFRFGEGVGYLKGIAATLQYNVVEVSPMKWKKDMGVTSDKQSSIKLAEKLLPEINLYKTERCKKKHDGMAEAFLIARWYYEFMRNVKN